MVIIVNGRDEELPRGSTLDTLISSRGLDPKTIIVEHNGSLVKGDSWPSLALRENDRVEILIFVGGG